MWLCLVSVLPPCWLIKKKSIKKLDGWPAKSEDKRICYRCGCTGHSPANCMFKEAVCHTWKKKGRISSACRSEEQSHQGSTSRRHSKKTHCIQDDQQPSAAASSGDECFLCKVKERLLDPSKVQVLANGKQLCKELDTGVGLSIISEATRKAVFPGEVLHPPYFVLKTYTD